MKKKVALSLAEVLMPIALIYPTSSLADNWNRCVAESNGVSGYQFKNICTEDVRLNYRPGGLGGSGGPNWRSGVLKPGKIAVLSSVASGWVACPLDDDDGKPVKFDQKKRACIVER